MSDGLTLISAGTLCRKVLSIVDDQVGVGPTTETWCVAATLT